MFAYLEYSYFCLFGLPSILSSVLNNYYQDLTFVTAQCHAVCMKNFMKNRLAVNQCIKSCSNLSDFCENDCTNHSIACLSGCRFFKDIIANHPGQCPPASISDHNAVKQPSCLSKCKSDSDCFSTLDKCCIVGCSMLCVNPILNDSIPQIAPQLKLSLPTNSTDVEFEWISHYQTFFNSSIPLTFILQTRVCPCKTFDTQYMDKWQTLIITTQSGARLNAFDKGKIYQFRLAVVSPYGTRGYGEPSIPFPQEVERPSNPSPPKSISELLTRVYSSGRISVTIGWQKPEEHDLSISEYVIKWMIDYGYVQSDGQAISALTQFTQSIPPDRMSYVLENLKPNTSYRIELYSKIFWPGDKPLVSEPTVVFVSTPALTASRIPELYYISNQECNNETVIKTFGEPFAVIHAPSFNRGHVRVRITIKRKKDSNKTYRVSWTPKICIDFNDNQMTKLSQKTQYLQTQSSDFEIKNIFFNCRYHLKIESFLQLPPENISDDTGQENVAYGYFCIPSCSNILVSRNSNAPSCSDAVTNPPPQPKNLSTTLLNKEFKSYRLSWNHPNLISSIIGDYYLAKYRIMWGPRIYEPVQYKHYSDITGILPIIDSTKSKVKVLSKDVTSMILEGLQPHTLYIVQAQLLLSLRDGQDLESEISSHYFYTGSDAALISDPRDCGTSLKQSSKTFLIIILTQLVAVIFTASSNHALL